ncbi:MAG: hypothetical protein HYX54_08410 [Chloroflexi bacterium]|nr:hypothetical protein [Chloroflexota bacterium]
MDDASYPSIVVLGRDTCEDTVRSRAHLAALGIPHRYRNVELEPEADTLIRSYNDGEWKTPTILIGDPTAPSIVLREPSDDELDAAIARA